MERRLPDRRAMLAGGALILAAALVPLLEPRRLLARELPPLRLERDIPQRFGQWQVDVSIAQVLPAPDVQAELELIYSQQLSRTYIDESGYRIMLLIAYGENQIDKLTVAHLPEGCYPAQGFRVTSPTHEPVSVAGGNLTVARLVATKGSRKEPITYWTTVGGRTFASDRERRFARITDSMSGVIPDGMLVRVSSIDSDPKRAFATQERFVQELNSNLSDSVRSRVYGRA